MKVELQASCIPGPLTFATKNLAHLLWGVVFVAFSVLIFVSLKEKSKHLLNWSLMVMSNIYH